MNSSLTPAWGSCICFSESDASVCKGVTVLELEDGGGTNPGLDVHSLKLNDVDEKNPGEENFVTGLNISHLSQM